MKAGVDIDNILQDDIPALAVRAGTSSGSHRSHTCIEYRDRGLEGNVSRTPVLTQPRVTRWTKGRLARWLNLCDQWSSKMLRA